MLSSMVSLPRMPTNSAPVLFSPSTSPANAPRPLAASPPPPPAAGRPLAIAARIPSPPLAWESGGIRRVTPSYCAGTTKATTMLMAKATAPVRNKNRRCVQNSRRCGTRRHCEGEPSASRESAYLGSSGFCPWFSRSRTVPVEFNLDLPVQRCRLPEAPGYKSLLSQTQAIRRSFPRPRPKRHLHRRCPVCLRGGRQDWSAPMLVLHECGDAQLLSEPAIHPD